VDGVPLPLKAAGVPMIIAINRMDKAGADPSRVRTEQSSDFWVDLRTALVAIVVQGWFGGAMVHGVDHMNW